MIEVINNLFIGTDVDCFNFTGFKIHACKTCHKQRLAYKGSLPSTHPNYLILEEEKDLFLNIVDMTRLLPIYTDPIMEAAMSFIDKHIRDNSVLIHCNQGISRSPGIALLYLAQANLLSNSNYDIAKNEFIRIYKNYNPGVGIDNYLRDNWHKFVR